MQQHFQTMLSFISWSIVELVKKASVMSMNRKRDMGFKMFQAPSVVHGLVLLRFDLHFLGPVLASVASLHLGNPLQVVLGQKPMLKAFTTAASGTSLGSTSAQEEAGPLKRRKLVKENLLENVPHLQRATLDPSASLSRHQPNFFCCHQTRPMLLQRPGQSFPLLAIVSCLRYVCTASKANSRNFKAILQEMCLKGCPTRSH